MLEGLATACLRTLPIASVVLLSCAPAPAGETTMIALDPAQRFQTIVGWEAHAQSGQDQPDFATWSDSLFDLAAEDLGINRLRLEVRSGAESRPALADRHPAARNPRCRRFFTVNDNDDPRSIDWSGFDFSHTDNIVERVVLPLQRRLRARGDALYVNLEYVAFIAQCEETFDYVHEQPEEYAEFVLAAFLHLREKYGLVPDGFEILLEPDNVPGWTGRRIGEALVQAAGRLNAEGFHPEFIAPGTTSLAAAATYLDEIVAVPGAQELLTEISYHRYRGVSQRALEALARRAARLGKRTAMLEKIGADVDDLHRDLTIGNVSAWQQFTLAYPTKDNGAQYYRIVDGRPVLGSRTRYLRQYFHYVRPGAVRIGTTVGDPALRVAAFLDRQGRAVVVVHLDAARDLTVRGLPAGRYGASLTNEQALAAELEPLLVGEDGVGRLRATSGGVLTIYPL